MKYLLVALLVFTIGFFIFGVVYQTNRIDACHKKGGTVIETAEGKMCVNLKGLKL
jgi:hypothetical protein